MSALERFSPPADFDDLSEDNRSAWSDVVAGMFNQFAHLPQLYDPTKSDTPEDAIVAPVAWTAFPARVNVTATSQQAKWELADSRDEQDEYCEWSVKRDTGGKIRSVTFTSEVPQYYEFLAEHDPDRLLRIYREHVSEQVELDDLFEGGKYNPHNQWNSSPDGVVAHLKEPTNNLFAAIALVAQATVPRERNGRLVVTREELARCAGLGNPDRNSDPQIAAIVNSAARSGDEVTLADPIGLYLDSLDTTAMVTPDGTPASQFWVIERGTSEHTLRARFEVPDEFDYAVSDITLKGRPITTGAQLAERILVRITAVARSAEHNVAPEPCEG